jgi:hypothetical protein
VAIPVPAMRNLNLVGDKERGKVRTYEDLIAAIRNHKTITSCDINKLLRRDDIFSVAFTKYDTIPHKLFYKTHLFHRIGKKRGLCGVNFVYYQRTFPIPSVVSETIYVTSNELPGLWNFRLPNNLAMRNLNLKRNKER